VDPFDYVEEVARKRGFDAVESVLPRTAGGGGLTKAQQARRRVNAAVAGAGFVEVISLPFMGDADLDHLGLDAEDPRRATVKLANPLDDTHPYLRTTLLPGLIEAAGRNLSRSQDDLAIFETGTVFRATSKAAAPRPAVDHRPSDAELAEIAAALPAQPRMLAGLLTGHWLPDRWDGAAVKVNWTHAVLLAEEACHAVGLELQRRAAALMPWHPGRCAELVVAGQVIGHAGELHPTVCRKAGLPARSCAVELDLDALIAAAPGGGTIRGLSTFPVAKEDVALVVDEEVSAAQVREALVAGGGELLESVELFDVYAGEQVGEHRKSLAFSLRLRAADRTLTDVEAAEARDAAVARAEQVCGAQLRAQ
ncbi:MAG: phenylalanine--tRNA ligase subunit beta, partial [Cutibacterium granulosum]|nr:phenylalanine--tRNA ligase subunit beta [Cutibacterium granulosum]